MLIGKIDYVCAYCGGEVQEVEVTMYPSNKPGKAYGCPKCRCLLFQHELFAKDHWPTRKAFLATRAGKLSPIGNGER